SHPRCPNAATAFGPKLIAEDNYSRKSRQRQFTRHNTSKVQFRRVASSSKGIRFSIVRNKSRVKQMHDRPASIFSLRTTNILLRTRWSDNGNIMIWSGGGFPQEKKKKKEGFLLRRMVLGRHLLHLFIQEGCASYVCKPN